MIIFEDTAQKIGKHQNIYDYCKSNGITIERQQLNAGDYTLPANQSVCVDTKYGLKEVAQNVCTSDISRLKKEIIRAKRFGIRLVFLIEEAGIESVYDVINWSNPPLANWQKICKAKSEGKMKNVELPKPVPPSNPTIARKMNELARLYGVEWQFCDKSQTGKRIVEILSNDS